MKLYKVYFNNYATIVVVAENVEAAIITANAHHRSKFGTPIIHRVTQIEESYPIVVDKTVTD